MKKKNSNSIVINQKHHKKKKNDFIKINILIIKLLIIGFIVFGFYFTQKSYENTISLLAVTEDSNGAPVSGSIVELNLKIKPGTGQIYTNLNTIEEVDTQISIINSQKIACSLFSLDCSNYDFYYNFKGSALVLKGPSASSAIAILATKTVKKEPINEKIVITGALNSGGIIGNVGGINQKIMVAEDLGFEKVLIPVFSEYNQTIERNIEVIKVLDIIEAYNNFNSNRYELETQELNRSNYLDLMKIVGDSMCERSLELKEKVDTFDIIINSSEDSYKKVGDKSYNSSLNARKINNYYSQGSFCYNSNLNYRVLFEKDKNLSLEDRDYAIDKFDKELELKYVELNSKSYQEKIKTINDFYVYLLLMDRLGEAREFLEDAKEIKPQIIPLNQTNKNNETNNDTTIEDIILSINPNNNIEQIKSQKDILYSYAIERYYTVTLWEKLIINTGDKIRFNNQIIGEACLKINKEISIKSQLLDNYGFGLFNQEIDKQLKYNNPFENKYLCIYKGLELNGKINALLNSIGINAENQANYTSEILNITKSRLAINSNGDFPLIPYIYYEYATDLFGQEDFGSSILYSNFALSYTDLNLYLEKERVDKSYLNSVILEMFGGDQRSVLFIFALLIIVAFLN